MKGFLFNLLFCLLLSIPQIHAQVDSGTAAELQVELDNIITSDNIKGLSAAIMFGNGALWTATAGISHEGQAVTSDMLFGIGSITKTYTATTVLSMYEDGLLDLDDPISDFLPDFDNIDPTITVRQLLQHTSGVYDYIENPGYLDAIIGDLTKLWEPEETINQFVNSPVFSPGTMHQYSNTNYILLGMIVESISGNLLSEEMVNRIFEPANLDSTFLNIEQDHYGLYAHPWFDFDGNGVLDDLIEQNIPFEAAWSSSWADGAIVATAADLARFSQALFVEESILSPATLSEMKDFSATNNQYGLGIYPTSSPCENWIGHNGQFVYSGEWAFFEPVDISIAILYNQEIPNGSIPVQHITALCDILKNANPPSSNSFTSKENFIEVYPQPAKQFVRFSIPSHYQNVNIQIYSVDGKMVKSVNHFNRGEQLDISDLVSGIYVVKIESEIEEFVTKLIVE